MLVFLLTVPSCDGKGKHPIFLMGTYSNMGWVQDTSTGHSSVIFTKLASFVEKGILKGEKVLKRVVGVLVFVLVAPPRGRKH